MGNSQTLTQFIHFDCFALATLALYWQSDACSIVGKADKGKWRRSAWASTLVQNNIFATLHALHYSWLFSPSQDPQPILEVHVGHFKALQISKLYKYKAMAEQSVEMMIRGVDSVGRV